MPAGGYVGDVSGKQEKEGEGKKQEGGKGKTDSPQAKGHENFRAKTPTSIFSASFLGL